VSVWIDGLWMLDDSPEPPPGERELVRRWQEGGRLARDVAQVLDERGPTSCHEIARALRRRKEDVLNVLRGDSRFEHDGRGRGSRWRLAARMPLSASQEQIGTFPSAQVDSGLPPDVLKAENANTDVGARLT
jgi:hypothetical protein